MITTTQYNWNDDFCDDTAWVSSDDVYIGNFHKVGGVIWKFKTSLINGCTSEQLREIADKLDEFNQCLSK